MGRVLGELTHLRDKARENKKEKEKLGSELVALRVALAQVEKEKKEMEDIEMGGTSPPSPKTTADAATNTVMMTRTYAQVAAQPQEEGNTEKGKRKVVTPAVLAVPAVPEVSEGLVLPQRFPYVEDLSDYEEEGGNREGTMAKAVVLHGVPIDWRIGRLASWVEEYTGKGKVIGIRWLVGVERRVGKTASSVVVYLDKEVFLGEGATLTVLGKRLSVVPYRWRA